jgi:hypothetical protein
MGEAICSVAERHADREISVVVTVQGDGKEVDQPSHQNLESIKSLDFRKQCGARDATSSLGHDETLRGHDTCKTLHLCVNTADHFT